MKTINRNMHYTCHFLYVCKHRHLHTYMRTSMAQKRLTSSEKDIIIEEVADIFAKLHYCISTYVPAL